MKEFDVTITETLKLTVSVEASSKEEAQQMVKMCIRDSHNGVQSYPKLPLQA